MNGVGVLSGPASMRWLACTLISSEIRRLSGSVSHTRAALPAKQQSRITTTCRARLVTSSVSTLLKASAPGNTACSPATTRALRSCRNSSLPALGIAPCPAK